MKHQQRRANKWMQVHPSVSDSQTKEQRHQFCDTGGASGFSYTFLYCYIWAVDEVKGINSTHSGNLMVSSQ